MKKYRSLRHLVVGGLLTTTLALSACGSDDKPGAAEATGADADLVALLPQQVRDAGVIKIGSSFSSEPMYYYTEDNKPAGMVIDVLEDASKLLGLKVQWVEMPWPSLLVALKSHKIDVAGAQFTRDSTNADQATYLGLWHHGISLLVRSGTKVDSEMDVCGLTIGTPGGDANDLAWAEHMQQQCADAGAAKVTIKKYDQTTDELLAVRSSQIDAMINSTITEVFAASQAGDLEVKLRGQIPENIAGIALGKDDTQLAKAYEAAIGKTIQNGQYAAVFNHYGIADMALDAMEVDPNDVS